MNTLAKFLFLFLMIIASVTLSIAQDESIQLENLTREADVILTGKVSHRISGWNDTKTRIFTKTTLQVDEFLKGDKHQDVVDITYPGGEVGEVGELYSHMPRFTDNEEVLVFLKKDKKSSGYKVLNGEEGKIRLIRNVKTNEKMTGSNMPEKILKSEIKRLLNKQN